MLAFGKFGRKILVRGVARLVVLIADGEMCVSFVVRDFLLSDWLLSFYKS